MNVVFYHSNGIIPISGGISRITNSLCSIFKRHGHNVWLIGAQKKREVEYDINQIFLPNTDLFDKKNLDFFEKFCKEKDIDIVINQAAMNATHVLFISLVRNRIPEIKYISCIHNSILCQVDNFAYQYEYDLIQKNLRFVFNLLKTSFINKLIVSYYIAKHRKQYKRLINESDKIILLSNGMKNELYRIVGSSGDNKITIIPNFTKAYNYCKKKSNIVLWVGTIDFSVKRIHSMLDVWEMIEKEHLDWKLMILGDGKDKDKAIKYLSKKELKNVYFIGRTDPTPYYEAAKIICVTSSHESFSLVTLEAMSHGCVPIVNNSFPAASNIIDNGINGFLIRPFDNKKMAETLSMLMINVNTLNHTSANALFKSHDYDEESVYMMWDKVFHGL